MEQSLEEIIIEMYERIKKISDLVKLDNDIEEGENINKNECSRIEKFNAKINRDYSEYIALKAFAIDQRRIVNFNSGTRPFDGGYEELCLNVRLLKAIKYGKFLEEILKVVKNEQNIFFGGESKSINDFENTNN